MIYGTVLNPGAELALIHLTTSCISLQVGMAELNDTSGRFCVIRQLFILSSRFLFRLLI